jgi:hypothetical protein
MGASWLVLAAGCVSDPPQRPPSLDPSNAGSGESATPPPPGANTPLPSATEASMPGMEHAPAAPGMPGMHHAMDGGM